MDNWLSEGQWGKPFSPKPEGCPILRVKNLMNQEGVGWNEELIKELFTEVEAQAILRIPTSSMGANDRLVCNQTRNGQCIVSSGYKATKAKKKKDEEDEGPNKMREEDEKKL